VRRACRALGAGFVPTVLAVHAGGLVWSSEGIPARGQLAASLVFAAVWALAFGIRRLVRRTAPGRFAWGLALGTWVVVATIASVRAWPDRAAGPLSVATTISWPAERQAFLAGTGDASFRVTVADAIAGYGARPRRIAFPWIAPGPLAMLSLDWMAREVGGAPRVPQFARGVVAGEDVGARAVVIRPAGPGAPLAICRLDLVMCDEALSRAVLGRVADLGFTRETLLVCATHTHSGPGGFSGTCLAEAIATDHFRPEVFARIVGAAAEAIRSAHGNAVPARIGFVRAKDEGPDGRPMLAQNRSAPDSNFVDRELLGIRLDAATGGRRIALLLNAAVHPTWGRPKDLTFGADLAGALERADAIAGGATVVFVNGAEGDVRPRVRHATIDAFASAVGPQLAGPAASATLRVSASGVTRDLGAPRYVHRLMGDRARVLDASDGPFGHGAAGALGGLLALPATAFLATIGAPDVKVLVDPRGGVGIVVALGRMFDHETYRVGAIRLETDEGAALIAAVPAELNTSIGLEVKASGRRRGGSPTFLFGLCNDYAAYVASRAECDTETYESRMTLFGPDMARAVTEAIDAAFDAVGAVDPAPGR
jgi:hypothetical protein